MYKTAQPGSFALKSLFIDILFEKRTLQPSTKLLAGFHEMGKYMLTQRRSGILLHPTSLSGAQPLGSLGSEAYAFVDALVESGQSIWQILPLGPSGYNNCPYSCFSTFAGNPLLINLELLTETGELEKSDLPSMPPTSDRVDFAAAEQIIIPRLKFACDNFTRNQSAERHRQFYQFCAEQAHWLEDYALYQALRHQYDMLPWNHWPEVWALRDKATLRQRHIKLEREIELHKFFQFIFFEQWFKLKKYANERGILIFGDLPIFVAEDSADVWSQQRFFHLDEHGKPTLVAGVPPDYFSATGQHWGNPLYRWDKLEENHFSWWKARFQWNVELFDLLRVDHFCGFSACWAIPSEHETAEHGYWMDVPGEQLFQQLMQDNVKLPLIVEDLGIITDDVIALRDRYHFPGMKILQFAFDSGAVNPYLPHNLVPNSVVYTGTHDNDTSLGWWDSIGPEQQQRVENYLRTPCTEMPWPLIETSFASVSILAISPLQDILSLPTTSRMNIPGSANGNWEWRMNKDQFTAEIRSRLRNLSHLYGRNLCNSTEM